MKCLDVTDAVGSKTTDGAAYAWTTVGVYAWLMMAPPGSKAVLKGPHIINC